MPWSATRALLDKELAALDARNVVLQIAVAEKDLRLDGELRASARPEWPGVRLLFDSKHGPLTYQCDGFWTWQDNVRAIALGLEALRKVERYGITEHGEQYKGWLQIEAAASESREATPREVLAAVIGNGVDARDVVWTDEMLFRAARAVAHPDRATGSRELWDAVERAGRELGLVR